MTLSAALGFHVPFKRPRVRLQRSEDSSNARLSLAGQVEYRVLRFRDTSPGLDARQDPDVVSHQPLSFHSLPWLQHARERMERRKEIKTYHPVSTNRTPFALAAAISLCIL